MSRKSQAELIAVAGTIDSRPAPPKTLNKEQQALWKKVCAAEPVEFFKTPVTQQLLMDYCRHQTSAEWLTKQIECSIELSKMEPDDRPAGQTPMNLKDLDTFMKMRDRETRAATEKATKLRLTNQSRYTTRAAATAGKKGSEKKPWHAS